jgi:D-alanyl-D-alanine carboxypeptidase
MACALGDGRRWARHWFAGLGFTLAALLSLALSAVPGQAEARPAPAAIVVDAQTGAVILENNSRGSHYPASLTKMMTLYLLFEAIEAKRFALTDELSVSTLASQQPPTKIGVKAGGTLTVQKAILALIVHSANDVAVVVAEAVGGSQSNFAALMTKKARALGMKDTVFRNASGLPDPAQVTTARDMAILARALISRFPDFYPLFATQSFAYGGRTFVSHNRVLKAYAGADGLKTGYIRAAGYNLVTSAERNGQRLIAVVLGGKTASARDARMVSLLDEGFATLVKQPQIQTASALPTTQPKAAGSSAAATQTAALVPPAKPDVPTAQPGLPAATGNALSVPVASLISTESTKSAATVPPTPPAKPTTLASATVSAASVVALLAPSAAAAAELPPDQPAAQPATQGWGIQVGAFSSYGPAQKAALKATKHAPKLLKDARVIVDESVKSGSGKLYRARLIGLNKDRAQQACRTLRAKDVPCLVFQTDLTVAMGNGQTAAAAQ